MHKLGNETVRLPLWLMTLLTEAAIILAAVLDVFSTGEASVAGIAAAVTGVLGGEVARSQTNSPATEQKQQLEAMAWGAAVAERDILTRLAPDVADPGYDPSFDPFLDAAEGQAT